MKQDIDWNVVYNKTYDLSYKDSGTYRMLGVIIMVPALLLLVLVPLISAMLFLIALFMFYSFYRNRSRKSVILETGIIKKEAREEEYRLDIEDEKSEPLIARTWIFHVKPVSVSELGFSGPVRSGRDFRHLRSVKVPADIYDKFNEGDSFIMILTPAGELAAYYSGEDFVILDKTADIQTA